MPYIDNILPLNRFILLDQKEIVKYINEIVEEKKLILMIVIPHNNTRIVSLHFKTNI